MASLLIDFNEHGKWYNEWLDATSAFKKEYDDHQSLRTVATAIVNLIEAGLKRADSDPAHSFLRYGSYDKDHSENLATLAQDVMAEVQHPHLRQYVVSFFHSGGVNHEELADLFDLFTEFCDHAVIRDDDSDDGSESDDDDESEVGEDNVQEQSVPSQVQWSWGPSESYNYGPHDPNILY
jgi:hypothetical protein